MLGFILYECFELIYYSSKLTFNIGKTLYNLYFYKNNKIKYIENITDNILEDYNIKDTDNDKEKIDKLIKINKILSIKLKELENNKIKL